MKTAEKIEKLIKAVFKTKQSSAVISSQMDEKILDDALAAFEKSKMAQSANLQPSVWRIIMKNKITKLAVAAVIIIAVMIGIHLSGNFFESSAYAQVVKELRNARTVVFTLINQVNGETLKTDMAYKEPNLLRSSTAEGYVAIFNRSSGKVMSIVPTGRFYTIGEIKGLAWRDGKSPFESIESMKNLPAKADEELGTKEIDGVVTEGYRVKQGDAVKDIWIDSKTKDLVQVELKFASAPGMNKIIKNIKFDVELDDSLFNMTPPEGYRLANEMKVDASASTEESFIEFLRIWSSGTVDETFPPLIIATGGSGGAKVVMDMAQEGKFKEGCWSKDVWQRMTSGILFVLQLPQSSNWRYVGENIKFGTSDKAIFWYQPKGSQNYRVIYGNLSVEEVTAENLPK